MLKKILLLSALLAISSCVFSNETKVENLLKTSKSWDGNKMLYPKKGIEEMTSDLVTIPAGKRLPFHCHPFPTFAYMKSGSIEVEKMDGSKKKFKKGDIISEVVNRWHRGRNISSVKKAEIVVFYIGQKSVHNTIMHSKENHNKCKI